MIKSKQNPLQEEETLAQAVSSRQGQKLSLKPAWIRFSIPAHIQFLKRPIEGYDGPNGGCRQAGHIKAVDLRFKGYSWIQIGRFVGSFTCLLAPAA